MFWLKLIILVIGTTRAIRAGRICKNGLSQSHVLTNSYRNGRPNVLGQHEPRGLLLQALCVYCVFMGEVSQDNVSPMSHLIFVILINDGEEELRALGPDRMSIMVATELVRHCKAHRELCTQRNIIEHSQMLPNTAKHYPTPTNYQTLQNIIQQNITENSKTLSKTTKH